MDGKKLKKKNFISPEISQLLYGVDEFFGVLTSSDSHKGPQGGADQAKSGVGGDRPQGQWLLDR